MSTFTLPNDASQHGRAYAEFSVALVAATVAGFQSHGFKCHSEISFQTDDARIIFFEDESHVEHLDLLAIYSAAEPLGKGTVEYATRLGGLVVGQIVDRLEVFTANLN